MAELRNVSRKLKRTSNACIACRQSKIKCTGEDPCANCQRRRVDCRFLETVNKIMVSERYLRQLQGRANQHQPRQQRQQSESRAAKRTAASAFGSEADIDDVVRSHPEEIPPNLDPARTIWTSPFTLPSRIIKKNHKTKRNWTWLAPTSTWSFTARLKIMIAEKLRITSHYGSPELFDGDLYPISCSPVPTTEPPDISGLPSIDHALYLFSTVKFHLGHNFQLIDEEEFMENTHKFYYGDAVKEADECRLWFVQFLLMLAFGNAFLLQTKSSTEPPGYKFFLRAMALMPDTTSLARGGFSAVEALALTGLYLYSIDHRSSAHVYIGHAIRLAQMDGMHTQLPEAELGHETVTRCRNLWWTLYVLDRHISSSVGASMTPQDSDITTLLDPPSMSTCSQSDATLGLLVRLSHLLSYILSSIYKSTKTQLGTFLETTRSILQVLAGHAREIETIIHLKFHNSVDAMPKGTKHITLLYHQCVIVATRPLLLSVVKERLERLGHAAEDWQSIVAPTNALISAGIKSAAKTLRILMDEDSLLEIFLPFDMEFTYGAAMHVIMAAALFPNVIEGRTCIADAYAILDQMIQRGNKLAAVRKSELVQLETLFQELSARIERRGLEALTLPVPAPVPLPPPLELVDHVSHFDQPVDTPGLMSVETMPLSMGEDTGSPIQGLNVEFLDSIGISSFEFFSLVNQIGNVDGNHVLDDDEESWGGGSM
ncbi:fungal-specific transcription factor domain-containing protein [Aspergillus californicus]